MIVHPHFVSVKFISEVYYKNVKADYLSAIWHVINFDEAEAHHTEVVRVIELWTVVRRIWDIEKAIVSNSLSMLCDNGRSAA